MTTMGLKKEARVSPGTNEVPKNILFPLLNPASFKMMGVKPLFDPKTVFMLVMFVGFNQIKNIKIKD